jgi:hypothetical protein
MPSYPKGTRQWAESRISKKDFLRALSRDNQCFDELSGIAHKRGVSF